LLTYQLMLIINSGSVLEIKFANVLLIDILIIKLPTCSPYILLFYLKGHQYIKILTVVQHILAHNQDWFNVGRETR
jgi:hypothetical protein